MIRQFHNIANDNYRLFVCLSQRDINNYFGCKDNTYVFLSKLQKNSRLLSSFLKDFVTNRDFPTQKWEKS